MRAIANIFFLFVALLAGGSALAQQYILRNYTTSDGLAHSNVFQVFQDRKGFLWFSTNFGLSRFDGRTFHNYDTYNKQNKNCIINISETPDGKKLVSTYGAGLCYFDRDKILHYPLKGGAIPEKTIGAITYQGKVWVLAIGEGRRLYCIDNGTARQVHLTGANGKEVIFNKITELRDSVLFSTDQGIYCLSRDEKLHLLDTDGITGSVSDVKPDMAGGLWISMPNRLVHIHADKVQKSFSFNGKPIRAFIVDHDNIVWAGVAGSGIVAIQDDTIATDITSRLQVPEVIINDISEDNEGNIWVATVGKGVFVLSSRSLVNYSAQKDKINSYCKTINSGDRGDLYIGSIGAMTKIDDAGKTTDIKSSSLQASDYVYFVNYVDGNILWGTPDGLYEKMPSGAEHRVSDSIGTNIGAISYLRDSRGIQWVGSFNNLFQVKSGLLVRVNDANVSSARVNCIAEDSSHRIWFGTDSGVVVYNGLVYKKMHIDSFDSYVNAILADRKGNVWIATDNGLYCCYGNVAAHYTTANKLLHNVCSSLGAGADRIYIGTMTGLSAININTHEIVNYCPELATDQVLSVFLSGSKLYLGLVDRLCVLDESTYSFNKPLSAPLLYITSVKTGAGTMDNPQKVDLPYRNNRITIEYIGINYKYAEQVTYRYRITSLDDEWHYTGNTSIDLPSLPSGEYTFEVSCRLNNGPWSKTVTLPINVATPFWKSVWFITLALLAAAACIFAGTRFVIKKKEDSKRKRLGVLNKIIHLKQQALAALINPHFIFNCLNAIQHYLNRNDNDKANEYLADFANLIRITLEQAQEQFISLEQEVTRIRMYLALEQLRFGNDLNYTIVIDPRFDQGTTMIPNMMLQPYIENAIWHGIMPKRRPGNIVVEFVYINSSEFRVIVEDDGVGMQEKEPKPGLHQPFGMKLTEERMQLFKQYFGKEFSIGISPARSDPKFPGTRVEINLPLLADKRELGKLLSMLDTSN